MKAGFRIIPAEVVQDPEIDWIHRGLFAEIEALSQQQGYCWANNAYLAGLMGRKARALQGWLDTLEAGGHICRATINGSRAIIPFTSPMFEEHAKKCIGGAEKCIPHAENCTGDVQNNAYPHAKNCIPPVQNFAPIRIQVEEDKFKNIKGREEGTHKARAPKVEVEPIFPSLEFREAWISFKLYRRREKKGWYKTLETEQTAIDGLMKRAGGDIPCIVDAIKVSIENRYTGIFPKPKHKINESGLTDQQAKLRSLILEGQAAGRGRPGGGHR